MKTTELAVYSIQCNMLGAVKEGNEVKVLLNNGDHLIITCEKDVQAFEIKNTLLYFSPSNRDNNAKDFIGRFSFTLKYKKSTDL